MPSIPKFLIITSNSTSYPGIFGCPLILKALEKKIWEYEIFNLYDFGISKHKKIDDSSFGGGDGLLIRADVIERTIDEIQRKYSKENFDIKYYCTDPSGQIFDQKIASEIFDYFSVGSNLDFPQDQSLQSEKQRIICFLCPRFEGVDSRIFEYYNFEKISIGKFIVTNGDLAVSVIINSVLRSFSGVLGKISSSEEESFSIKNINDKKKEEGGAVDEIEFDQFTSPRIWKGLSVPEVLLSGNHEEIRKWRLENSKKKTLKFRADNKIDDIMP
jgi:tRNA (guanine37-N1)-methyltransferase